MNLWTLRSQEPAGRSFRSYEEAGFVELAAAVIEQAVIDWEVLQRGKLTRCVGKSDAMFIYTEEVVDFFQSRWFEHLLSYVLPTHTAPEVRKALDIPEPRRKKRKCVKH